MIFVFEKIYLHIKKKEKNLRHCYTENRSYEKKQNWLFHFYCFNYSNQLIHFDMGEGFLYNIVQSNIILLHLDEMFGIVFTATTKYKQTNIFKYFHSTQRKKICFTWIKVKKKCQNLSMVELFTGNVFFLATL